MRTKMRVVSLLLVLLTLSCAVFMSALAVNADEDGNKNKGGQGNVIEPVVAYADKIVINIADPDLTYMIFDGDDKELLTEWMHPHGEGITFDKLVPETNYTIKSKDATGKIEVFLLVSTEKMANLTPIIIVLAVILAVELFFIVKKVIKKIKDKKASTKLASVVPVLLFGTYVSKGAVVAIVIMAMGVLVASGALVLLSKTKKKEEEEAEKTEAKAEEKPAEQTEVKSEKRTEVYVETIKVKEVIKETEIIKETVVERPDRLAETAPVQEIEEAKEETTVIAAVVEEPVAEEPVAEEPVAEEPVAEEPVAEEPVAEEPVAEEPVAEEPVAEEPVAEESVAEEPVAEEPVVEEPVVEEPVVEEPVVEEPQKDAVVVVAATSEEASDKKSIINDDPAYAKIAVDEKGIPITPEGMIIRYKWSALARIYNAAPEIRYYYMVLRRLLLSYKKVRSNISWNYDSYFLGRKQLAKMKVRGKALMIYLPFEFSELEGTKYRGKDVSKFARYKQVPFCYRVNGNRKLKYAMELIRRVLDGVACTEPEYVPLDQIGEAIPYQEFEPLYLEGLIKISSIVPYTGTAVPADDDDDDDDDVDDDIDNDNDGEEEVNEDLVAHTATGPIAREDFHFVPPTDKKRTTPVFEHVSANEVSKLMTDEEAKAALYDLTKPEPVVEEPKVEETKVEEPVVEEPVVEESVVEESKVEETAVEEKPVEEIKAEPAPAPVKPGEYSRGKSGRIKSKKSGKIELINIDTLSKNFKAGDYINLHILKEMKLVPKNTSHVKVLARGMLDKPLTVCANQFSLDAIKMIILVGGNAVKTNED